MKKSVDFQNLDFEISFYLAILKDKPDFVDALMALGDAYTKRGHYEKGLHVDLKLVKLKPGEPTVWYNLACSHSLLGSIESAFIALNKAVRLGYCDFQFMETDPDLENLRKDKRYKQFLSKIVGRNSG